MDAQANKSPHTLFWIAGIAVTVFSEASATMWRAGDRVKVINGAIQSNA